jgi:hypothetical protein
MRSFSLGSLSMVLFLLISACTPAVCPTATIPGTIRVASYIDGNGATGISGRVIMREGGAGVADAYVNIYPDTVSNLLGPSQTMSSPTDQDGRYQVNLPPGTYFVVARKRVSGNPTGPLSPGDYYSEHQRVVTDVVAGKFSVVNLPIVLMNNPMFFKRDMAAQATDTAIRGRIVNKEGKPVFGAFAMAYNNADLKRLPDYASTLSDTDGRFMIYVPEGGNYYLSARMQVYDMPRPGEPYGKLETPVFVETGKNSDEVTIIIEPFTGEYQSGKSRRPY